MLVLSCHVNERIVIGEKIVVTFLAHKTNGSIRLGFDAPPQIPIDRESVRRRKEAAENRAGWRP